MTENEAIKKVEEFGLYHAIGDLPNSVLTVKAFEMAIKALEEIQQYRAIGTVEEIQNMEKEEDILKFYYCESEDEYYIGKTIDTMYYAKYSKSGFVWHMSRFLPWGEHVVDENSLWKEHTYPSEPKEIPFFEWLQGFIKKECLGTVEECREAMERQRAKKPLYKHYEDEGEPPYIKISCPNGCGIQLYPVTEKRLAHEHEFCPKCGQKLDWSE